jgi:transposase
MAREFTNQKKQVIQKYFESGMSCIEISRLVDISYQSICKYVRNVVLGLPSEKRRAKPISVEIKNLILRDLQIMRVRDIVKKYSVSRSTVDNIIYRMKVRRPNYIPLIFEESFQNKLRIDTDIQLQFQQKLPFNTIYLAYCKAHNINISYNTFYQACKRLGYVVKIRRRKVYSKKFKPNEHRVAHPKP